MTIPSKAKSTSISIIATVPNQPAPVRDLKPLFFLAWLLCAIFYFFQYAVRSAPGVMQEELTAAWGGNHIGAMISAYYVAYAIMALVAGVLLSIATARVEVFHSGSWSSQSAASSSPRTAKRRE